MNVSSEIFLFHFWIRLYRYIAIWCLKYGQIIMTAKKHRILEVLCQVLSHRQWVSLQVKGGRQAQELQQENSISIQKIFIWKFFKFSNVSNREDYCLCKLLQQTHRPVARKICITYREIYLIILPDNLTSIETSRNPQYNYLSFSADNTFTLVLGAVISG